MNFNAWSEMVAVIDSAKGGNCRDLPEAKSWERIVREARQVPSAPQDLTKDRLTYLCRKLKGGGVFDAGLEVRAVAAALDVPLVDLLSVARWWPDLRLGMGISPVGRVVEGLRLVGVNYRSIRSAPGRFIIEL